MWHGTETTVAIVMGMTCFVQNVKRLGTSNEGDTRQASKEEERWAIAHYLLQAIGESWCGGGGIQTHGRWVQHRLTIISRLPYHSATPPQGGAANVKTKRKRNAKLKRTRQQIQ